MYKLIRFYNQNRKKILITILIIVFIIGIIQLLNYLTKVNNEKDSQLIEKNTISSNKYKELLSEKSAISGDKVSSTKLENDVEIIKEFIKYCNEQNINSAYEILTDECKEEMFPTIQDFYNIYYSKIFNQDKKIYTVENWFGNIYQVKFTGDILSTGNLNNNETKQDYITIVREDGVNRLNVNNYIGKNNLNKTTEYKDIKITVTSVDTYMEYEIYNLSIENNSENTILLDTSDDVKSVYLLDIKDMKYYFYGNEIIQNKLVVESKYKNTLQIKFNNTYSSSKNIRNLVFSKLVLNYEDYIDLKDKSQFEDFCELKVEI